ncbi:MAG: hypothetical protein SFV23_08535 [Planctomycetaceae bacterium]|nr:hypothetical protein [Planctomycetaceae bacterium]
MVRRAVLMTAIVCAVNHPGSAVFADDPAVAPALPGVAAPTPAAATPDFRGAVIYRKATPTMTTAAKSQAPASPADEFQKRLQQDRERQRRQEIEYANRPTEWQLQNPSGQQNHSTVDPRPTGYVAPNTYYGPQFRDWSRMSAPAYERKLPPNMQSVPPLTKTQVMVAPYTYWGADNQRWLQMTPGNATQSGLGGWNYRVGW